MNRKASPPAIEIAIIWTAAACLGGAVGFAVSRIAPFGAGLVAASVAGAIVALAAGLISGRVDRGQPGDSLVGFLVAEDVLLLDQPIERDDVLLLDDPLLLDGDSRVVRLFAAHPVSAAAPAPLAGPGEMIARIEDYLGLGRGSAAAVEPERRANEAAADDASAALHAALADIRRSLRQS